MKTDEGRGKYNLLKCFSIELCFITFNVKYETAFRIGKVSCELG